MRQVQSRLSEFVMDSRWENEEILPYGAKIAGKGQNVLRAALQNINGISYSVEHIALEEIDAMDRFNIDLLGMTEINFAMNLDRRLQLASALQMRFTGSRVISSSMKSRDDGYLPGGTTMITQGPLSGRVYRRGSDHLGRFSWMALRGINDTGIIVITGYRVCQNKGTTAGTNTAYMREWAMLREEGYQNPDPRLIVLDAIREVLNEWMNRGYHPLVMMDANGELDDPQLDDFIQDYNLYDLIAKSNDGDAPRTYQRSGRRLDYILGDEHILASIVKSGSMGSGDGVSLSDHTLQFVDLDCKKLFGVTETTPHATYEREFKLKDVKKKDKFLEELHRIYDHQNIKNRVEELAEALRARGPTPALVQAYQVLDDDTTRAMRAAAKLAGRKDFGYQRSDVLVNAGQRVRLMKTIASCVRNKMGYSDKVRRLAEVLKFNLPDYNGLTYWRTRRMVTEAVLAKREIQRMAAEHRALWLDRMAQEAATLKPGSDWEKILKRMITASKQKVTNKRLNNIFRPEWSSLDYIEVPNEAWYLTSDGEELYEFDNGIFVAHKQIDERVFELHGVCKILPSDAIVVNVEIDEHAIYVDEPPEHDPPKPSWRTVEDPAEMQEWLRRRNKRHLNQMHVEERPPTRVEFQKILAEHGTSEIALGILDGTIDPATLGLDEQATDFIAGLAKTDKEKELSMPRQMTTEEFQASMKVTHEDTSSSASGLHYTLWKAIAEDKALSDIHAIMISLPFMYGFICNRWKKIIDCMLEKKPGVRKIHIMRIICLFEADFNTLLKWMFNKFIMPNAEKSGLSPNQWGGRNNCSAPACAMRKLLSWEYARFTKTVLTSFLADLQSNFDCILPDMSSIFLMKKGATKEAAHSRAATMANLERSVRTATGTSVDTYQHDPGMPPLPGEGQGKADSMAIWTLISSELLLMHHELCHGVELIDVTGEIKSRRVDDTYVDDSDTYATAPKTNTAEEAVENLEQHSQIWVILTTMTGQLLAFHKCMWQIIFWISVAGEYLMASDRNIPGELWLKDSRGKHHKIKRKPATQPNPGLGFLLCPNADQKYEYEKRLKQAQEIAQRVSRSTLPPRDAWLGLKTRVIPKICYPFGLTRFTTKQLKKIGTVINNVFVQRIGFNRNTPRVILNAPHEFGGFNLPCMETIQDQKGITLLLRQLQWGQENAQDIKIVISQAQLDSGLTEPILEDTKTWTPYIEEGLIQHIRDRLAYLDGRIAIEDAWCPKLQRDGDVSIMQALSRLPKVTKGDLKKANLCRKWMKVITIAELASIDGKYIPANRVTGQWRAKSSLRWPRQPPPTKAMWDVFRRLMKRAFCSRYKNTLLRANIHLDNALGAWYQAPRHIQYDEYRTRVKLFQRQSNGFQRFVERDGANYFVEDGECDSLPLAAHPAESTKTLRNKLQAIQSYSIINLPAPPTDDPAGTDEIDIEYINQSTNIIAASDASVNPITGEAAFNWRITTYEKRGLITKSSYANSNPMYMNSYRGEMAGIQDLVDWLHTTELRRKVLKIVCDNESCVKSLNKGELSLVDLDKAESDLIRDIVDKLRAFDDVTIEWVRGHQDDDITYDDLPIESQLNIDCDAAAKLHLEQGTKPQYPPKPIVGSKATLYLGGYMVTTDVNEQIQMAGQSKKMLAYAADKFGWTDNQAIATVNWRAIGRAKRRLKLSPSVRTTKMMYNWLNVGSQKKQMGGDSICPCCGTEEEDQLHLYRCTDDRMQSTLKESLASTNSKLVKEGLVSPVYTAFMNCVCEAIGQPSLSSFEIEDEEALRCIDSQETLGHESILRGFHHIDWLHLLRDKWVKPKTSDDGKKKEKRKDPLEQSVVLVQSVWNIFEAQWKCRNDILHSNDSALIERSRDTLTTRLLEFKRNSRQLLRSCDRFIIENHNIQDVIKWPLQRKKAMIDLLERLYKVYSSEVTTETASYRDISEYFIKLPPKDTAPLAPSFDTEPDDHQSKTHTASTSSVSEDSTENDSVSLPQQRRQWRCRIFESSSESS